MIRKSSISPGATVSAAMPTLARGATEAPTSELVKFLAGRIEHVGYTRFEAATEIDRRIPTRRRLAYSKR